MCSHLIVDVIIAYTLNFRTGPGWLEARLKCIHPARPIENVSFLEPGVATERRVERRWQASVILPDVASGAASSRNVFRSVFLMCLMRARIC